ncbi:MAG: AMP-binding protein [Hyphomicrobiaceae bacterium]|nr:AMP-binding protein [Hyphomicrobiaceae bacterium]
MTGSAPGAFLDALSKRLQGTSANFVDLVHRAAQRFPDKAALIYGARTLSYAQLSGAITGFADMLRRLDVAPGDRVALHLDNSDIHIVAFLGILDAGAVAVTVNTKLVAREIAHQVVDCAPVLYVTQAKYAAAITASDEPALRSLTPLLLDGYDPEPGARSPTHHCGNDENAAIYYTSGTTGRPKGAVHTHRSLIAAAMQGPPAWEYDDSDVISAAVTPLFHIASPTWYLPVLCFGGTLVIDTYDTDTVFELIARHRINSVAAVPSMLLMMARSPGRSSVAFEAVRNVRFGAAPMPPERLREVQGLFPNAKLVHGMGQTESCGTIVTLDSRRAFDKAGSVGRPIAGCSIRLVDDDDQDVPPGQVGELLARGPHIMKEYHNNPSETARTLRSGWLHTGDMGYWDAEQFLYLVDRKKDMIIRGGENIYSTEVENALYAHPEIARAAVVGMDSDVLGEEVCAFVVPQHPQRTPSAEEIIDHCRALLAPFKLPQKVLFVESLPMTPTGKIQKNILKERVSASLRSGAGPGSG